MTDCFCRICRYFSKEDTKKVSVAERKQVCKACKISREAHKGQMRSSGEDFFDHPVCVAKTLIKWGASTNMIIAAVLHDCVEDTSITIGVIREKFGEEVALYVYALTKDFFKGGDPVEKNISFLEEDPNILVIKLADRLHNMQTLSSLSERKRKRKSLETLSVYVPIARMLKMYEVAEELKKLAEKYYSSDKK